MTYQIRVLTSCTGEKRFKPENQLRQDDFRQNDSLPQREAELSDYFTEAQSLYTGQQHLRLMRYLKQVQAPDIHIDLDIVSAGYGFIGASKKIAPYECTFQGMKSEEIREWSSFLNIPNAAREWFSDAADVNLILLGESYLRALYLDTDVQFSAPTIFFTSSATAQLIPKHPLVNIIPLVNADAKRFSCGLVGLKGELGGRALTYLSRYGDEFLSALKAGKDIALDELDADEFRPKKVHKPKPILKPEVEKLVELPSHWYQAKHRNKLMFYVPDWDDMVDPDFDFESDKHSGNIGTWGNQVYSHQLHQDLPSDGILVSKAVVDGKKAKVEKISEIGIHAYLRLPNNVSVMGDCGAFSYLLQDLPPYTIEEVISYYTECGFNYGISLDHLLFGASDEAGQKARYELTVHNAEVFFNEHQKQQLEWEPIGALQGMNVKDYVDAAKHYIEMGYKYLAIGGQVRSRTDYIYQIVSAIRQVIPADVKLHLLGVARLEAISQLINLGVNSVDSASYLRQAWIRSGQNYIAKNGDLYTAVRIPQVERFILKQELSEDNAKRLRYLEQCAMQGLRLYEQEKLSLEACLEQIITYTDAIEKPLSAKMLTEYQISLGHRPWTECDCKICRQVGIEVIIFRGNNRNRRRGFHNNYIAYQEIQNLALGGIPKLSWKKAGSQSTLPMPLNYE